jgi:hypothetical protein
VNSRRRQTLRQLCCAALAAACCALIAPAARAQQGSAVLVGNVRDASSGKGVADSLVSVTSPALQGEEIAVTDELGAYRIPGLPPGMYRLRVERAGFRPYAREQLDLHADTTIRLNVALLPDALQSQAVVVVGRTPTVDTSSSSTGMNITADFTQRVPVAAPGTRGSAARSFESVADVVPGAQPDAFGVSIFGSSSPENRYLLDGLPAGNATLGVLGTPLSMDFIKEVSVVSGGYMPEYGRATGGILNAITKSGSNEFRSSVFSNWSPAALSGQRKTVRRQGETIVTEPNLAYMGDVGGDVGGPIVRDKLWFYFGFDWSETKYKLKRSLHEAQFDDAGQPLTDDQGGPLTALIPGTTHIYSAQQDLFQGIAKLTWAVDRRNRLTLSANGVYPVSGGGGKYGVNPLTGQPEIGTENTTYTTPHNRPYAALAHRYRSDSTNLGVKWSSILRPDRAFLDTWLGWNRARTSMSPSDGAAIGSQSGLGGVSNAWWLRNDPPHSIGDFESLPAGACAPPSANPDALPCPVLDYRTGGPEFVDQQVIDRVQVRSIFTYLFQALGHHVFKLGVDLEHQLHDGRRAYTGTRDFTESADGSYQQILGYGYLTGPDEAVWLDSLHNRTRSVALGGFVQDSWSVADVVTLNLGLRYDAQLLYAADQSLAMTLPRQWSPRVGVIYDPTREGRAKLFANFARFYESVPLRMLDRYLSGEPLLFAGSDSAQCDPRQPGQTNGSCLADSALTSMGLPPNDKYYAASSGTSVVDPKIKAPSTDEFVAGADYELLRDGRIGVTYTKRWLNSTIEDMSRDEGQTFFFGNPGYGIARDFPKAQRKYDGVTLYFTKLFSQSWLAQASYTLSWLRGNYSGLFRPEDLQFDPHQSTDFDIPSLIINRSGPLPGDHRHFIKLFGAKEFKISDNEYVTPGLAFRAVSGDPTNYLGAHPLYGVDQVYILPRGSGERLPWNYSADVRLSYRFEFTEKRSLSINIDVFNLFNFQHAIALDQRYTTSPVAPIAKGGGLSSLSNADGTPFDPAAANPNFGRATGYQAPRVFRFGMKVTF